MESIHDIEKQYGTPESPVTNDALKLDTYTTGISEFIKKCPTPMTISLQGDWGSGKTSLFNLIEKKLNNGNHMDWRKDEFEKADDILEYPVITINTWQFAAAGYQDNLSVVLLAVLSDRLKKFSKLLPKRKKGKNKVDIEDLENIVSFVSTLIMSAGGRLLGGEALGELAAAATKDGFSAVNQKPVAAKNIVEIEKLKAAMQSIITDICNSEDSKVKKFVIFVDDLDRLEPKNAVELLEGIKNFVDCENCVFVLALDQNVVFEGVKEKYGAELGEVMGKKFFDKIIQVPFTLPVVSYDVKDFIKEQRVDASDNLIEYYNKIVSKLTDKNPRTIKRLINMSFLYEQFETEKEIVIKDVYKAMLLALLAVQIKDEEGLIKLVKAVAHLAKDKKLEDADISMIKGAIEEVKKSEVMIQFAEIIQEFCSESMALKENEVYTVVFKVLKGALGASCSIEDAIRDSLKPKVNAFKGALLEGAEDVLVEKVLDGGSVYEYGRDNDLYIRLCAIGTSFSIEIHEAGMEEKLKSCNIELKDFNKKEKEDKANYFYYEESEDIFKIIGINNQYSIDKLEKLGHALGLNIKG